jgi:alpha-tubulin suppressor-like RCC1 family protein
MSQSNLAIPNESGAAFRADVNAALQALVSQSAGANPPATTYPLQMWADTTNALLKIRNAANSAWITLGTLDKADIFVGSALDGGKLVDQSLPISKLKADATATAGLVLSSAGPGQPAAWSAPQLSAASLTAGSITADKLAAGVTKGKVKQLNYHPSCGETNYWYSVLMDDGTVRSVGQNVGGGVLGCGGTSNYDLWVEARYNVPPTGNVKKVLRTFDSQHILFDDGKVYACGNNGYGQLGLGDTTNRFTFNLLTFFTTNGLTVSDIFVRSDRYNSYTGFYALCSNGAVYACGYNGNGELGVGDVANRATPTLISGVFSGVKKIVAANHYTFMLMTNGNLYATGYNAYGTLGLGDTNSRTSFTLVSNLSNVADIFIQCGRYYAPSGWTAYGQAFALIGTGDLYGTGYNGNYNLGLGDTNQRNSFTKIAVSNVVKFSQAGGGVYSTSLAYTSTGDLYAWGSNNSSPGGNGLSTNIQTPWKVQGWAENTGAVNPPFYNKVSKILGYGIEQGNYGQAVILDTDGNLWAVGRDNEGQCGTATQTINTRWTRVFMPTLRTSEKFIDIDFAGYDNQTNLYALTNLGKLFATGYAGYSQTGNMTARILGNQWTLQPCLFQ